MSSQSRSEHGRFASKSDEPREVRSIRLTDSTWQKLGDIADSRGITRADLIEELAQSGALDQQPTGLSLQQVEDEAAQVLNDPTVTRNGKDRGSVRRALEALIARLSSV